MEESVIFDTTTFPNINVTINSMNNDKNIIYLLINGRNYMIHIIKILIYL